jgi:hypothetical protein
MRDTSNIRQSAKVSTVSYSTRIILVKQCWSFRSFRLARLRHSFSAAQEVVRIAHSLEMR